MFICIKCKPLFPKGYCMLSNWETWVGPGLGCILPESNNWTWQNKICFLGLILEITFLDPHVSGRVLWNEGCPPVRTSVCTQRFFSGTVHYFFLKLSMILKYHKGWKVTRPFFWEKFLFPWKRGQKDNFGPKMTVFRIFSETVHYFFLKLSIMFKSTIRARNWHDPFFWENSCFHGNRAKRAILGLNWPFFQFSQKTVHTFFLELSMMF